VQGIKDGFFNAKFGLGLFAEGALGLPSFGLIPSSGDGPTREVMLNGYLKLYGRATLKNKKILHSIFTTPNDPGYMDTAKMLVVAGVLLLRPHCAKGGVVTPAYAFENDMTEFLTQNVDMTFSISEPCER